MLQKTVETPKKIAWGLRCVVYYKVRIMEDIHGIEF